MNNTSLAPRIGRLFAALSLVAFFSLGSVALTSVAQAKGNAAPRPPRYSPTPTA